MYKSTASLTGAPQFINLMHNDELKKDTKNSLSLQSNHCFICKKMTKIEKTVHFRRVDYLKPTLFGISCFFDFFDACNNLYKSWNCGLLSLHIPKKPFSSIVLHQLLQLLS